MVLIFSKDRLVDKFLNYKMKFLPFSVHSNKIINDEKNINRLTDCSCTSNDCFRSKKRNAPTIAYGSWIYFDCCSVFETRDEIVTVII